MGLSVRPGGSLNSEALLVQFKLRGIARLGLIDYTYPFAAFQPTRSDRVGVRKKFLRGS